MSPKQRKPRGGSLAQSPAGHSSLTEWLAVRMDVPADALGNGLRLDMWGRNTLTVHGCTHILGFSPEAICLCLEEGTLTVGGERLICTSYLAGAVGIEGRINSIIFCEPCEGEVAP